jgi:Family of unknown function (DUF6356)
MAPGYSHFKPAATMENPFTSHPKEVGEGYFRHMANAASFGAQMAVGAAACFVHAVFPFLLVNKGSHSVEKLHRKLHKRTDAPNWERHPII